ncbi:MAG: CoA-binding protein [Sarcina sp.]
MDANYLISNFKNWVVIGDVLNTNKYASKILTQFKNHSYTVAGVHPSGGDGIYKALTEVPYKIDAIDLCINPIQGLKYLKSVKDLNIKYILIQPGASL